MDKIEGENVKIIWTVRTYSFRGQFIEPIPTSHDLSESCNSVSKLVTTFVVNSVTLLYLSPLISMFSYCFRGRERRR